VNKNSYVPITEGDQIKFGESTRICIFHTEYPEEEVEEQEREVTSILSMQKRKMAEKEPEDEGITW
jgi:hypothetical protein